MRAAEVRALAEEVGKLRGLLADALVDLRSLYLEAEDGALDDTARAHWLGEIDGLQSRVAVVLGDWKGKPALGALDQGPA